MSKLSPTMINALRNVAGEHVVGYHTLTGNTYGALERRGLIEYHGARRDLTADGLAVYVALIAETGLPTCKAAQCENPAAYRYVVIGSRPMFVCADCSNNGTRTDGFGTVASIKPINRTSLTARKQVADHSTLIHGGRAIVARFVDEFGAIHVSTAALGAPIPAQVTDIYNPHAHAALEQHIRATNPQMAARLKAPKPAAGH